MKTASGGRNGVVGSLSNSTFRGAWRSGAFLVAHPLLRTIHPPLHEILTSRRRCSVNHERKDHTSRYSVFSVQNFC
jgi:hypothetical protein